MLTHCKFIDLPQISDPRGNLTFAEENRHIPFNIKRAYYLYDIPSDASRAGHAHKELKQLFIALSGSFDLRLDDGHQQMTVRLDKPYKAFYVCPMIWRDLDNFSPGSICMVFASLFYDENDYYRVYKDFISAVKKSQCS